MHGKLRHYLIIYISVDGKSQITTRFCGYLANNETFRDNNSCFKDAFSAFTSSIYCDCLGDRCNKASESVKTNNLLLIMVILFVISFSINQK